MLWDQDVFKFQVKVNFSSKKGKQYTAENLLTPEDLKSNCPYLLTQ